MSQIPFAEIRAWMFEAALPFWADHGVDHAHGGFLEELTLDGAPTDVAFKRHRVTCRQTYVFSHAAVLGWPGAAPLSQLGFDYMVSKARLPGGGWARRLSRDGAVIDASADLYDLAFTIFALAWRYRASKDPEALRLTHQTLDFIQANMRAPHGGYWHIVPTTGPRQQNPHMHLTEACIFAFEASGDERFLAEADDLVALFKRSFFDGRTLGEFFTEDWRRIDGDEGRVVEPGHQFEWAWILTQYAKLRGVDVLPEAEALVDFGERYGVDPASRAVYDSVREDGAPLRRSSRAWTNTERIKAWLALHELDGRDPSVAVTESVRLLFDRYFACCRPGAWIDQFDGEGQPKVDTLPASVLYHIFLAFAETLRLEASLKAPSAG